MLALWVHIQRISEADVFPSRALALGTFVMLLVLAFVKPTVSHGKADLSVVPTVLHIDWYYLFIHPLMYLTSPAGLWLIAGGATCCCLSAAAAREAGADCVVNPPNCNGCRRCFVDCPYGAIAMLPHPDKPGHELARVLPELCASCGICAGACPSSTPFRSVEQLVTGIDMPQQPIGALRQDMERRIAALTGPVKIAVFGCECAAGAAAVEDQGTAVMNLMCTGLLPPSFVEYALRGGADGVLVTGCREGSCAYRFGTQWTEQRLAGQREPHLRPGVPAERLRIAWADRHEMSDLKAALDDFRENLKNLDADEKRLRPYTPRRIVKHG
jgi:coenzyme F420-reducing hydrogenase delta subunit/ferredoxin